uniref:Reverse transcriptase domain-containing protein n=1 Tax=Salmo trutta TaxID=8032 RepID=A0A674E9P8_SALTR
MISEQLPSFVKDTSSMISEQLPSFVKDTSSMISIIESLDPLPENTLLVTFDVESLYTNIPHEGGIEAMEHFLLQRDPNELPSSACIVTLAEIVLTHNYFMFLNDFFIQTKGTAMGSPMAPNYANLYVGYMEKQSIFNPLKNVFLPNIIIWKRYIDDIFVLWRGDAELLQSFYAFLNSCSEHLRFTMQSDTRQISFLDLLILCEDNVLYTDLYRKPTDLNSLLRADSCHPLPLKNSLPYSQFCRIKRICIKQSDFDRNMAETQDKFKERGYNNDQINIAIEKIQNKTRHDLFQGQSRKKTHSCVLTTRYSKCSEQIKGIVHKHWHILKYDDSLGNVFSDLPLVVFSRGRNLRDQLVHSDLPPQDIPEQRLFAPILDGNYKCNGCAQCNGTYKCRSFKHPQTGKSIPIKGVITCSTKAVIYLITCPCGKNYVGKTKRELKVRISEHRSTIRCKNLTYPVAAHFLEAGHSISSLRYIGIEHVTLPRRGGDLDNLLLKREAAWIFNLKTLAPFGLNIDFDLKPFL